MWGAITYGSVIYHHEFPFPDGTTRGKLLIVVGFKKGQNPLICLTTSKAPDPPITPGCHSSRGLFLCAKLQRDCWDKNTYALIWQVGELLPKYVQAESWKAHTKIVGCLSKETIGGIKNCILSSEDLSGRHRALLGN